MSTPVGARHAARLLAYCAAAAIAAAAAALFAKDHRRNRPGATDVGASTHHHCTTSSRTVTQSAKAVVPPTPSLPSLPPLPSSPPPCRRPGAPDLPKHRPQPCPNRNVHCRRRRTTVAASLTPLASHSAATTVEVTALPPSAGRRRDHARLLNTVRRSRCPFFFCFAQRCFRCRFVKNDKCLNRWVDRV